MNRICFLLLLSVTISCTPRPRPPETKAGEGVAVGKVGDFVVTDKMVLERVAALEKAFPKVYSTHVQKKNLLTEMMNTELLYRKALEEGLDKTFDFKSRLADLYVRQMSEKARAQITDKELQSFYEENKGDIDQISAKHILLKTEGKKDAKEKAELKKKIEGYRAELLKAPEKFSDYAMKYSEDGSKTSGGELGFFARGAMVKPFSDAAFNLKKVGDISAVVESQFGYHIIQLSGDRRGISFYKDLIRERLLRKTQRERLSQELAKLKSGKEFQVFEENLLKLSPLPKEVLTDPAELLPEGSVGSEKQP